MITDEYIKILSTGYDSCFVRVKGIDVALYIPALYPARSLSGKILWFKFIDKTLIPDVLKNGGYINYEYEFREYGIDYEKLEQEVANIISGQLFNIMEM